MLIELFNLVEGIFWIALGVWILWTQHISASKHKSYLSIILIIFGISDFVEMTTGVWWRPWWLLIWKALCVVIGLIFIILILSKGGSHENKR